MTVNKIAFSLPIILFFMAGSLNGASFPLSVKNLGAGFVKQLLHWTETDNGRQMPWKGEKDPYKIWISEIILQQTRVEQGLKYYENFITAYPTIELLSQAPEEEVYKLWEGLGYYSRCNNLIATAKIIVDQFGGIFPQTHQEVLDLKGIGAYTAAAITSFAYNLPYAVVDGNVVRVLSRIFQLDVPADSAEGKRLFAGIANHLLPPNRSAAYNQAIMDFGATICKPLPLCKLCFFNKHCLSYRNNTQLNLPVKAKKKNLKERFFNYLVLVHKGEVLVQKRAGKDIWRNLHQFVLIEKDGFPALDDLLNMAGLQSSLILESIKPVFLTQKLTHQQLHIALHLLQVAKPVVVPGYQWIPKSNLSSLAFPRSLSTIVADML